MSYTTYQQLKAANFINRNGTPAPQDDDKVNFPDELRFYDNNTGVIIEAEHTYSNNYDFVYIQDSAGRQYSEGKLFKLLSLPKISRNAENSIEPSSLIDFLSTRHKHCKLRHTSTRDDEESFEDAEFA